MPPSALAATDPPVDEPTPVVLVHGLWLLAGSWDAWRGYLEERGYDVSELGKRAATMIETHTMTISNSTFVNSDITNGAVNPPQQPTPTSTPTPTPA